MEEKQQESSPPSRVQGTGRPTVRAKMRSRLRTPKAPLLPASQWTRFRLRKTQNRNLPHTHTDRSIDR